MITEVQLRQIIPQNKYVEYWHKALAQLFPDYDINTPKRMAAFLAQCAHESGGFTSIVENLNYKPQALRRLFSKYFSDDVTANQYCARPNKQEAIANRIYANRMGNGDESSGDGYRFRGRGLIQLTGRSNYQAFADSLEMSIDDVPEYLGTFEGAAQSACWFWETNNLNKFADAGDILGMTKRINGGTIGLEDRKKHYEHALHIFGA
jgi:putative chitinase